MKKAYDLKVLMAKLKDRGLDLAEEAAVILIEETMDWTVESAQLSETPYDDMAVVIVPTLKKQILTLADKIDGEEG